MEEIIPFVLPVVVPLAAMGLARLFRFKRWWQLALAAAAGGALAGAFFASAASAMASSVSKTQALSRGLGYGAAIGLAVGLVALAVLSRFTRGSRSKKRKA